MSKKGKQDVDERGIGAGLDKDQEAARQQLGDTSVTQLPSGTYFDGFTYRKATDDELASVTKDGALRAPRNAPAPGTSDTPATGGTATGATGGTRGGTPTT